MRSILLLLLLLPACVCRATERPVIGILAVPVDNSDCDTLVHLAHDGATSCFHSLYVKWLEAAGAQVAPLPFDLPPEKFDALVGSLNGALITGGDFAIKHLDSPYMKAASRLYEHSLAMHSAKGERWPLWGTCMGMQVLSVLGARDGSVLLSNAYHSEGLVLPLKLTAAAATSRLLCHDCLRPAEAVSTLSTQNVTVNLHHDGVAPESFANGTTLGAAFRVLSTNADRDGKAFVSTIEAQGGAPVWGVQWHPERPAFDWLKRPASQGGFNRSEAALEAMYAVAARFVREARLSPNRFASESEEAAALIYEHTPVGSSSYQAYYF